MQPKFNICISSYNQGHLLTEAIESCLAQNYPNIEIVVLNDGSTDETETLPILKNQNIKYFKSDKPSGTGLSFQKAIDYSDAKYFMCLCADDIINDKHVVSDIMEIFNENQNVGHVSRFYFQFVGNNRSPCRAWRGKDVLELGNNPSGMAFRREAIGECKLNNKMFTEISTLISCILKKGWDYKILEYDTIAVRVHNSISQNKAYYLKRWVSSPIENWHKVGGSKLLTDYTSLVQIKNNFTLSALLKECWNFIRLRPLNLLAPGFYFYAFICIFTPRFILRKLPDTYRRTWGRLTTREIIRPCQK